METYIGWLILIVAAFILAFIGTKLVMVWFGKDGGRMFSKNPADELFNNRLYWSSYAAFFLISVFVIPHYMKDQLCLGL